MKVLSFALSEALESVRLGDRFWPAALHAKESDPSAIAVIETREMIASLFFTDIS